MVIEKEYVVRSKTQKKRSVSADNQDAPPRTDSDGAWKEILRLHLKDFMEFFWPEADKDIDWSRPYELLEQELMAVGIQEEFGKRSIDKLFKVF